jgi:hypothetical protein
MHNRPVLIISLVKLYIELFIFTEINAYREPVLITVIFTHFMTNVRLKKNKFTSVWRDFNVFF